MSGRIAVEQGAAELIAALHQAGYRAYAVGGCVRDSLLQLAPHDWDLCTSAAPQQVIALFGAERCIPTGLQHGTVTVKHGGRLYEVTTFRTEGAYTDGRHPDEVHFVPEVEADLARRDFTINAMAYNDAEGLIDPFGGQADLARKLVRAVGAPHKRFEEDALRILRLYRFAARFGFAVEPATGAAARSLCARLACVSVERIQDELSRLLAAPKPAAWMEPEVFAVVLPELAPDALAAAKPVVDACPSGGENLPVRLAALLSSLGEAGARAALKRLRCSNACMEETAVLLREQCLVPEPTLRGLYMQARRLMSRCDLRTVQRLAALLAAQHPQDSRRCALLRQSAEQIETDGVCCRVSQLAVNGRDLMALGIAPGPSLRCALEELLELVLTDALPNDRALLLDEARRRMRA